MNNQKISIIIPAYNEESYIGLTLSMINNWPITNKEIIVVDDGSTDQTVEILRNYEQNSSIKAIYLKENKGKGQALMEGVKQANGEIIMFLDADLGDSASDANLLLPPLLKEDIDMTVAVLPKAKKKGGFGLVKGLAKMGIVYFTGFKSRAPLSGQRAFKKKVINEVTSFVDGFGIEVAFTIDVLKKGFVIEEVEIPLHHRETGRDLKGFVHRGKEFIAVAIALFTMARKHKKAYK